MIDDIFQIKEIDYSHIDLLIHMCNLCKFPDREHEHMLSKINEIEVDSINSFEDFISLYYILKDSLPEPIQAGSNYSMKDIHNLLNKHC